MSNLAELRARELPPVPSPADYTPTGPVKFESTINTQPTPVVAETTDVLQEPNPAPLHGLQLGHNALAGAGLPPPRITAENMAPLTIDREAPNTEIQDSGYLSPADVQALSELADQPAEAPPQEVQ